MGRRGRWQMSGGQVPCIAYSIVDPHQPVRRAFQQAILGAEPVFGILAAARGAILEDLNMNRMTMVALTSLALAAAGTAFAQDQSALAKSSGCLNCHAVDAKKMGPSF